MIEIELMNRFSQCASDQVLPNEGKDIYVHHTHLLRSN